MGNEGRKCFHSCGESRLGHPQILDWSHSLWKGAMTFSGSQAEACGVGETWPTSAENPLDVGG